MASNPSKQGNFGLLPEPRGRFGSFGASLVVNATVGALLILFAAARVHQVKVQKENSAVLIFPVEPPKPVEVKLPTPDAPKVAPAPPKAVAPPPQPKVGLFKSSQPTLVANNNAAPTPKTGGFGDPVGVTPNPKATRPANIASVGSFSGTPGVGQPGAGAARQGSVKGVDFGSGVANGVPGGRDVHGTVASAGFSN